MILIGLFDFFVSGVKESEAICCVVCSDAKKHFTSQTFELGLSLARDPLAAMATVFDLPVFSSLVLHKEREVMTHEAVDVLLPATPSSTHRSFLIDMTCTPLRIVP